MPRSVRPRVERLSTDALLIRRVPFAESDLIVGLFTEERGLISALARGARRSKKRFAGLEPMHLLRVTLEVRPTAELAVLSEAAIARPRLQVLGDLARLDTAGRALRWVREIAPPATPEPSVWQELNRLLDRLDAHVPAPPEALLAEAGLRLLSAFGWGLELTQCVRCGRSCDPSASACADPARGGLVCRACGGARLLLRPELRARLLAAMDLAAMDDDSASLAPDDTPIALDLVEGALAAHASGG